QVSNMFPPHPLPSRLSHLLPLPWPLLHHHPLGFFRHRLPLSFLLPSHRAHPLYRTAGTLPWPRMHCRHPAPLGAPNPLRRFPPVSAPTTCENTPRLSA